MLVTETNLFAPKQVAASNCGIVYFRRITRKKHAVQSSARMKMCFVETQLQQRCINHTNSQFKCALVFTKSNIIRYDTNNSNFYLNNATIIIMYNEYPIADDGKTYCKLKKCQHNATVCLASKWR